MSADLSLSMAMCNMHSPFFTFKVKCGAAALDVADCKDDHNVALALRAAAKLFPAVKREGMIHPQTLAFSILQDHRSMPISSYDHQELPPNNLYVRFYWIPCQGQQSYL